MQAAWRPVIEDKSMWCWVGVDASFKHDSTAIVGVTWDRKSKQVRQLWHRIFQPTPDRPLDFEFAIEGTLKELSHRFQFQKVLFDPWQMQAVAQRLTSCSVANRGVPADLRQPHRRQPEPLRADRRRQPGPLSRCQHAAKRQPCRRRRDIARLAHQQRETEPQDRCDRGLSNGLPRRGSGQQQPYFDRSYSGFQDDPISATRTSSSYAIEQMKLNILSGGVMGTPGFGRW